MIIVISTKIIATSFFLSRLNVLGPTEGITGQNMVVK